MGASITLAGESLIAQKHVTLEGLDVVRFIFANVPGLDHSAPVDRAAGKPPANQIVYTATIPENGAGYVNPNQVVYSVQAGSDVGDWDFNWIGLETAENALFAVAYVPIQQKRKNIPPLQIGNNLTRNFLVVFDGAQALTGLTIDASTWQHDFTVRLAGIDKRQRQNNRDTYGRVCFFGSSLQLEKVGNVYQLKTGTAYVEGIRVERTAVLPVAPPALPTTAWLDVALQRELNDVVASWSVVFGANKVDYIDSAGAQHYCVALADIPSTILITDRRPVEPISGSLVEHFAARIGDYDQLRARATTKDDVELGNLPNAKSDDTTSNSSEVLATTKLVFSARALLQVAIDAIISGATVVGKAAKLATARTINGVAFDGSTNITIADATKEPAISAGTAAQFWRGDKTWQSLLSAVQGTLLTGYAVGANAALVATDSVLGALQKLQAQVNNKLSLAGGTLTGALSGTRAIMAGTGSDYASGGVELVGNGAANTVFPTIGFHQPSAYAASLQLRGATDFRFYAQGAGAGAYADVTANNYTGAALSLTGRATVGDVYSSGWLRTTVGWYNETYGGGMYMTDTTYVRTYNSKSLLCSNALQIDGVTPQVRLNDVEWGVRYLYHNAGVVGFLDNTGNWKFTSDNSGHTRAYGNITSDGIFYGNGAGLTNLNWNNISNKPFADYVTARGNNANGYYRVWSSGMKEMYLGALTVNAPSIILNLPIALNALYGANARATILAPGISSGVVTVNFLSTSQIQVFCAQSANVMIAIAGDM